MSEPAWKWLAELVGGPLDGETVGVEGCPWCVLHLLVPSESPSLVDYYPPSPEPFGPAIASYELVEWKYLDITSAAAFLRGLPERPVVSGKYRWRP